MKTIIKITASLLLALTLLLCITACQQKVDATGLWENATYLKNTTVGDGSREVFVKISAGDREITLTLKTDKETLGEALYEHEIINDPSFFNTCNGIVADWDKDNAYWAFYVGDDTVRASYGVADEKAVTTDKPTYRIVYTK